MDNKITKILVVRASFSIKVGCIVESTMIYFQSKQQTRSEDTSFIFCIDFGGNFIIMLNSVLQNYFDTIWCLHKHMVNRLLSFSSFFSAFAEEISRIIRKGTIKTWPKPTHFSPAEYLIGTGFYADFFRSNNSSCIPCTSFLLNRNLSDIIVITPKYTISIRYYITSNFHKYWM